MGKKSLIKSTTKKKTATKTKEEKPAQKTAAKASPKAPAKAAKKSTAAKTKSKPASPKAKGSSSTKSVAKPKSAPKKRTAKEILFQKFTPPQPPPQKISVAKVSGSTATAPPLISTDDPQEAARMRSVLARRFSMDVIKAAAKDQPAPVAEEKKNDTSAAAGATPEPKAETTPEPKVEPAAAMSSPEPAAHPTPEPAPYVSVESTASDTRGADPITRSIKIAGGAVILLILILLAVSANNSAKYYLKPKDDAVEIWKGDFSPKDKHFFMVLHGVNITKPVKPVYSKNEVYPLIFNYYLNKSDALLEVNGLPDFDGIRRYLHQAEAYAVTGEMKTDVTERLNTIKRMTLLYKADVAISRNTEDSLESAISILKDADKLSGTATQSEEIAQKITAARQALAALKAGPSGQEAEKQPQKD